MPHEYDAYDDDHGPMDSDYGDSESDHVWTDLQRSEFDPATNYTPRTSQQYNEYVRKISGLSRNALIRHLERSNRARKIHVVYGGPRSMSKDELISELARRYREGATPNAR